MYFKDIIGQEKIKQQLVRSVNNDRISHAQLFIGNEGVGKLQAAIAYARYVLCKNKTDNDACGTCPSCLKVNQYQHPDLHFSFPIILSAKTKSSDSYISEWREMISENPYFSEQDWYIKIGGENKKGVIGKDESQDIVKKFSLKAYEGGYKIMIIWKAETMNISAANKLLKIIEEPPKNTLFLLTSESDETLLPTILSRTQITKFNRLSSDEVIHTLTNKGHQEKSENIAFLAEGNFTKALHLANEDQNSQQAFNDFMQWMRFAFTKDVNGAVNWVETFTKQYGRESQKSFLNFALKIFRECLINNHLGINFVKISESDKSTLAKFAPFVHEENIFKINDLINEASYHIDRNANPKILFLDLSFKLFSLIKKN